MSSRELALGSGRALDVPPRCARLLTLVGRAAVIVIVIADPTGQRPETIGVDKPLHLGDHAALAAVLVPAPPARRQLPVLPGCSAFGLLIELPQPLNLRSSMPADALANAAGVVLDATLGLGPYLTYGSSRAELETLHARHSPLDVAPGAVIVLGGVPLNAFCVVKHGVTAPYRGEAIAQSRSPAPAPARCSTCASWSAPVS